MINLPSSWDKEMLPSCPIHPYCKKCFNTNAFAQTLQTITAGNTGSTTGKPGCPGCTGTYCAAYVSQGLQAGGINISGRPNYAGKYGSFLESVGFTAIAKIQFPHRNQVIGNAKLGDITVFGIVLDHKYGHIEGYIGAGPSGWASYWQQERWYVYAANDKHGTPIPPSGSATIYRSKCPCGQ
jgi:hypothetical protein